VNTNPLIDQCPLHFYILRILAHLYISAPSPTRPTCWYQVHASHYLLKLIERPSLIYCATYYWPTVGIRCAWHRPICRHQIHTQHQPTCWYQMHLASAHLLVSDALGISPSVSIRCIQLTDGPMPSASDTNRWANAKCVSDTNGWADVHLPSAHLSASNAHLPSAHLSVSDAYLPLAHLWYQIHTGDRPICWYQIHISCTTYHTPHTIKVNRKFYTYLLHMLWAQ
jgi:hypothetical protein